MIVHLSFVVPFVAFVFCGLLTFLLSISAVVLVFFYLCKYFLSLSFPVFFFHCIHLFVFSVTSPNSGSFDTISFCFLKQLVPWMDFGESPK